MQRIKQKRFLYPIIPAALDVLILAKRLCIGLSTSRSSGRVGPAIWGLQNREKGPKYFQNKNSDNSISSTYQQKDNLWKLKGQRIKQSSHTGVGCVRERSARSECSYGKLSLYGFIILNSSHGVLVGMVIKQSGPVAHTNHVCGPELSCIPLDQFKDFGGNTMGK